MQRKKTIAVIAVSPDTNTGAISALKRQLDARNIGSVEFDNPSTSALQALEALPFDGLVLIGGSSIPSALVDLEPLCLLLQDFDSARKLVGAVGLAIGLLAQAGLLVGKTASIPPGSEETMKPYGMLHSSTELTRCGWILTAESSASLERFAAEIYEMLK